MSSSSERQNMSNFTHSDVELNTIVKMVESIFDKNLSNIVKDFFGISKPCDKCLKCVSGTYCRWCERILCKECFGDGLEWSEDGNECCYVNYCAKCMVSFWRVGVRGEREWE